MEDNTLWYLILGTRGGPTRLQILSMISLRPYNANQIARLVGLDYKTVTRHLEVLKENGLLALAKEKRYGELYYLTEYAKSELKKFEPIIKKLDELG